MSKDEALTIALEALHGFIPYLPLNDEAQCGCYDKAITAIKEALAQPEPVAWEQFYPDMGKPKLAYLSPTESPDNACYIPPQRTWVGLTPQERDEINEKVYGAVPHHVAFHAAIEAKLRSKNP